MHSHYKYKGCIQKISVGGTLLTRNKTIHTDKRSFGSLLLLFPTNVYFRKLQSTAEYTPGCVEQAPFMKRYQRAY